MSDVFECKIKSRSKIDKDIPRSEQGWWADVCYGKTLKLRKARESDLKRCIGCQGKDHTDYFCELPEDGSLIHKNAIESISIDPDFVLKRDYKQLDEAYGCYRALAENFIKHHGLEDEWSDELSYAYQDS